MLPPRILSGIAVVVDVALLARGQPVSARVLAGRLGKQPRHLEALLRDLVRHGFLKGTRGPHGGYVLARERRKIGLGDLVRALAQDSTAAPQAPTPAGLVEGVILPALAGADAAYLQTLDALSVQDLTASAEDAPGTQGGTTHTEFHI